jgi:hypothetical protein
MSPFNPFEIRNPLKREEDSLPPPPPTTPPTPHDIEHHHKHEGSPLLRSEELSDEEVARLLFKTKPRRKIRYLLLIESVVLVVCLVAFLALGWIFLVPHKRTTPVEQPHRPHLLPTLLSVIDPETDHFVYALNNTLYERMLHAVDFVVNPTKIHQHNRRCGRRKCELPQLWLDKTSIAADRQDNTSHNDDDSSVTLIWTLGRDGKNGNILLQDDDVIALYCGDDNSDPKEFLDAATVAQAKATSVRDGGTVHDNTWFLPEFPILQQETCHFRLYLVMEGNTQQHPGDMAFPQWQYLHVSSTAPLKIEHAKETPTALHLAYASTFSTMIVQFTTGNLTSNNSEAVPVVRYAKLDHHNHSDTSETKLETTITLFETATGSSDSYSAEDMCQEPANQTEAGKFYPPGMLHTVEVLNLQPSTTYQYQVGVSVNGSVSIWSELSTFTTAPPVGDTVDFSYIVYGDQGCPETGCRDGKKWLDAMMQREVNITSVHHFGDIR